MPLFPYRLKLLPCHQIITIIKLTRKLGVRYNIRGRGTTAHAPGQKRTTYPIPNAPRVSLLSAGGKVGGEALPRHERFWWLSALISRLYYPSNASSSLCPPSFFSFPSFPFGIFRCCMFLLFSYLMSSPTLLPRSPPGFSLFFP